MSSPAPQRRAMDARRLPPQVQEDLRRRVVAAVEGGMSQLTAAQAFGVSRRAVGTWVRANRAAGPDALRARRRGRAPGEQLVLNSANQAAILGVVAAGPPDSAGLAQPLWNRRVLAELIEQRTEHRVSAATAGHYLLRWGLTASLRAARPAGAVPAVALFPGSSRRTSCETLWVSWNQPVPQVGETHRIPPLHALLAQSSGGGVSFLASGGRVGLSGGAAQRRRVGGAPRRP
ncbi:MAG: helix-turn-helix domain-containing protein, partial [Sporichthyaceae bacterium]